MSVLGRAARSCARCGSVSPLEARFCMRCGEALWDEPWQTAPVVAVSGASAGARAVGGGSGAQAPRPARSPERSHPTQPPAAAWPAPRPAQRHYPHPYPHIGWGVREVDGGLGGAAAAFAAPSALWRSAGAWLTPLDQAPPATPEEAQVCLAAVLAVVCVALSLTAPFMPVMTAFAAPGLALGAWSAAHVHETSAPREFRWLALAALALGSLWLLALILHFALTLR
jgi:RNA polymerase subunit RPABC4/transcription elongation factor Spt4